MRCPQTENESSVVHCASSRCAALVAFAKAAADPDAFYLSTDTAEARSLFDDLKKLKTKYKKDRRFFVLTDWKHAGFLEQDPDDKLSCVPSLALPSTAEEEELLRDADEEEDELLDDERISTTRRRTTRTESHPPTHYPIPGATRAFDHTPLLISMNYSICILVRPTSTAGCTVLILP